MDGGGPGALGRNTWIKQPRAEDGDIPTNPEYERIASEGARKINIGGKATVWMGKGDRLLIETPGGGAWGVPEPDNFPTMDREIHKPQWEPRGSFAERAKAQAAF